MKQKVIFDTNAYINFATRFLADRRRFNETIQLFKKCEEDSGYIPSFSLLAVMELYQYLHPGGHKYNTYKNVILFSFERNLTKVPFSYTSLPEVEISEQIFQAVGIVAGQLNQYLLTNHLKFCSDNQWLINSNPEFVNDVRDQIDIYKETSYKSIVRNFERLFTSFDSETLRFSESDYKKFKTGLRGEKFDIHVDLGVSLFEGFMKGLNIETFDGDKYWIVGSFVKDYLPAFHWYVKIWKKFSNNNYKSRNPFVPKGNDLFDGFILFSVKRDTTLFVTDEKEMHVVFDEVDMADSIMTLDEYLKKIEFCPIN